MKAIERMDSRIGQYAKPQKSMKQVAAKRSHSQDFQARMPREVQVMRGGRFRSGRIVSCNALSQRVRRFRWSACCIVSSSVVLLQDSDIRLEKYLTYLPVMGCSGWK